MMALIPCLRLGAAAGLAALLAGCASVKAVPETAARGEVMLRPPSIIYIAPFDTSSGMWQGRAQSEVERTRIRDWLAAQLELTLSEIAPTELLDASAQPASGWLVTGRFIRVNPGNKAQRTFIGFGAGGSKLETKVSIYDLAVSDEQPVLMLNTTGGSNLQMGPTALVSNSSHNDIERTAREVRDFIRGRLWPVGTTKVKPASAEIPGIDAVEVRSRRIQSSAPSGPRHR